jgi:hypothetical protein
VEERSYSNGTAGSVQWDRFIYGGDRVRPGHRFVAAITFSAEVTPDPFSVESYTWSSDGTGLVYRVYAQGSSTIGGWLEIPCVLDAQGRVLQIGDRRYHWADGHITRRDDGDMVTTYTPTRAGASCLLAEAQLPWQIVHTR